MSNFTPEYIQKVRVCSNLIEPPAHDIVCECLDEVLRLNAYAMKLLSDETRMWHCDNCGEEFESYAKGKFEIPDATRQCPLCETGIARPKAWIMQERIDELTEQVERLTKALDEIIEECTHLRLPSVSKVVKIALHALRKDTE